MNVGNRFARIENNTVGYGEITVNLLRMGENDKLEGTLLVKKGRLQRKIKVITVKTQKARTCMGGNAGLRPQYRRARDADVHDSGELSAGAASAARTDFHQRPRRAS